MPAPFFFIKSKSGVSVEANDYPYELGYVFVLLSARRQGLSIELTRSALSARGVKGVFSTARTDNLGMHATLKKFGFVQAGNSYASGRGNHKLQVFVLNDAQLRCSSRRQKAARLSFIVMQFDRSYR